jgi:exosome complex component RRP4
MIFMSEANARKIVVPGDYLSSAEARKAGKNVFLEGGKIYSSKFGIFEDSGEFVNVVPLKSAYEPRLGDIVIGYVQSELFPGYVVDIGTPALSFISKEMLRTELKKEMIILAKISKVNELKQADIELIKVLPKDGIIINTNSAKIPRMIGKNNSMLEVMKKTGCLIYIGKNGRIWAKGDNSDLVVEAIKFIEENAHKHNLTAQAEDLIKKGMKDRPEPTPLIEEEDFTARISFRGKDAVRESFGRKGRNSFRKASFGRRNFQNPRRSFNSSGE